MEALQRVFVHNDVDWDELDLTDGNGVRYNSLVNLITKPSERKISHSNTLSLPLTSNNIKSLRLNLFNHLDLASKLNKKYRALVKSGEQTIRECYLVINNTHGDINVNLIDKSLDLLDLWGSTTFRQILTDDAIIANMPTAYQDTIREMQDYYIEISNVLPQLSHISGLTVPLAEFPNSLNPIGDKFNIKSDKDRQSDTDFNSRQSRPVFNARSFLEASCYAFGYSPILDNDIDIVKLQDTYITPKSTQNPSIDESAKTSISFSSNTGAQYEDLAHPDFRREIMLYKRHDFPNDDDGKWITPNEVPNFVPSLAFWGDASHWGDDACIYQPTLTQSTYGTIFYENAIFDANSDKRRTRVFVKALYENALTGGPVVWKDVTHTPDRTNWVEGVGLGDLSFTIEKEQLVSPPTGGKKFIGIMVAVQADTWLDQFYSDIVAKQSDVIETYREWEGILYDEHLQYELGTYPDLRLEAPDTFIKKLMSSILNNSGLLIDIDEESKKVTFYPYDRYETKFNNSDFVNISDYVIKGTRPRFDTNFGTQYGQINRFQLTSPYPGNTFDLKLTNQDVDSKLDILVTNTVKEFKDVSEVIRLTNRYEFTNKDLGLVESARDSGGNLVNLSLTQADIDGVSIGAISLPHINNYNYGVLPKGVTTWYSLINKGVRVTDEFIIPNDVYKGISLKDLFFVDKLGGAVIIEEIKEYKDQYTPVAISFIRPNFT